MRIENGSQRLIPVILDEYWNPFLAKNRGLAVRLAKN